MAPRVNKATQELIEKFDFEIAEVPEREASRRSRYDDLWTAARNVCESIAGKSIKTRTYNGSSGAYQDATKINNGEHRMFKDNADDSNLWTAIAGPGGEDDVYVDDDGNTVRMYAVYLTYNGQAE